ncbi:hypothetical protein SNE40_001690 [Patella caerulea]|uniref:Endonuclease/exonuclease/phosphatase domain-containing protein n=1 Tax=Patella caerulea TaxID=87958 RepID=A0AAN8K742_PATCE
MTIRTIPNNSSLIYSSQELLQLRNNVTKYDSNNIYNEIKVIASSILKHKPTRRKPKYHIPTLITSRVDTQLKDSCNKSNSENLIHIELLESPDFKQNTITTVVDVFQRHDQFLETIRQPTYTSVKLTSSYDISKCLNFTLWNARSLGCKIDSLCASIISNQTDVCLISESWITDKNGTFVDACFKSSISGFSVYHVPRCRRKGGGLAMLSRSNLRVKKNKPDTYTSMEVMDYNIYSGNDLLHIVLIYRPPYSKAHKITVKTFLCEFGSLMESAMTSAGRLIVAGDINIHVDDTNNTEGRQFIDLFTSLGLVQHVVGPTHTIGHTLDLVLTRAEDVCVTNFVIDRSLPSDHASVHFTSTVHRPPLTKIFKEHRSLADLDITSLKVFKMILRDRYGIRAQPFEITFFDQVSNKAYIPSYL